MRTGLAHPVQKRLVLRFKSRHGAHAVRQQHDAAGQPLRIGAVGQFASRAGSAEGGGGRPGAPLVDMIENQRSYEVQANLMKEAKSLDENSASLMRLPS